MDSILIVDDEKDNLKALERLLRKDYKLTLETSPLEALKKTTSEEFAVVISDQKMPQMTGVDLLEKIRSTSPSTIRMLLTGYSEMEAVVSAINRGHIYHYIAKPFDPEQLKITLQKAVEAHKLQAQLEQKNRALEKSNQELKSAYQSLRLLDRAKARFLSLISHELKTPLTVLTSYTQLLKGSEKDLTPQLKKVASSIEGSTERFEEIIEEVLLYTKLESEESINLADVPISDLTLAKKKSFENIIKSKTLEVDWTIEKGLIVRGDPEKLAVAVDKLISETLELAPQKSEVRIELSQKDNGVHLSASRFGDAISDETFSSLVAPGEELHHHKGLGLSLAICRLIVESHDGELLWESSEDKGTDVTIILKAG